MATVIHSNDKNVWNPRGKEGGDLYTDTYTQREHFGYKLIPLKPLPKLITHKQVSTQLLLW